MYVCVGLHASLCPSVHELCAAVPACVLRGLSLKTRVRVTFYLLPVLFSGLYTHSVTGHPDMKRHSQVALSDCYHWLPIRTPPPQPKPSFACLPFSLPLLLSPSSSFPFLSSVFGCALTWLSLWVCFAGQPSACYSSPGLIKEENWNPFNQNPHSSPPSPTRIAVRGWLWWWWWWGAWQGRTPHS